MIRGPGSTIWGANAVNGVTNIITKKAGNTAGGLVAAGAGSYERGFSTVRSVTKMAGDRPPSHQVSLRSQLELTKNIELNLWGRYVGTSEDYLKNTLSDYLNLDARLGWRSVNTLEFSLVGRNLLHQRLQEYHPEFIQTLPSGTAREVYGKVTWSF